MHTESKVDLHHFEYAVRKTVDHTPELSKLNVIIQYETEDGTSELISLDTELSTIEIDKDSAYTVEDIRRLMSDSPEA